MRAQRCEPETRRKVIPADLLALCLFALSFNSLLSLGLESAKSFPRCFHYEIFFGSPVRMRHSIIEAL